MKLKELERLAKRANIGPWDVHPPHPAHPTWTDETFSVFGKQIVAGCWSLFAGPGEISSDAYVYAEENARFIAAANPTVVLNLIALLKDAMDLATAAPIQFTPQYHELLKRMDNL